MNAGSVIAIEWGAPEPRRRHYFHALHLPVKTATHTGKIIQEVPDFIGFEKHHPVIVANEFCSQPHALEQSWKSGHPHAHHHGRLTAMATTLLISPLHPEHGEPRT